ncbi:MAG: DUF1246 domain-containing protein [Desulfobacterales bacterium]|nr:DUF1246 domain-containing protein [Desulfobacterales bacterium]
MEPFDLNKVLEGYDTSKLTLATVCSHTSLQIFDGAKKEGFRTLGIAVGRPPKVYDAFPRGKPDEFMILNSYEEIFDHIDELLERNCIVIPHGSFVMNTLARNGSGSCLFPPSATAGCSNGNLTGTWRGSGSRRPASACQWRSRTQRRSTYQSW